MKKHPGKGALHAERVELALAQELTELFRDEITDPSLEDVLVLSVQLSKDGRYARVHVALSEPEKASPALVRAAPFLRANAASSLSLERIPELRFVTHPRGAG